MGRLILCFSFFFVLGALLLHPSEKLYARFGPDPAYERVEDRPDYPNVLLIGDSISLEYTPTVRALLKSKFDVFRIPENGETSAHVLSNLDRWLAEKKWDVIHYNAGLHDIKRVKDPASLQTQSPSNDGTRWIEPDVYQNDMGAISAKLAATGARVIFATTTPVPDGAVGRDPRDVDAYNEVGLRLANAQNFCIDDLNGFIRPFVDAVQWRGNVHFYPDGDRLLGGQVARAIIDCVSGSKALSVDISKKPRLSASR